MVSGNCTVAESLQFPLTMLGARPQASPYSSRVPHSAPSRKRRRTVPPYMRGTNMMCAFGVPGNISHGWSWLGMLGMPVVCVVAKGMYTT